jgi:gluconokinase
MSGVARDLPTAIVVMGVSGSGKSTVGALLARHLGWDFKDGDAFHPPANVEKMRSGAPLTDADRWPWLDAIAAHVAKLEADGGHVVVACSALKRVYRDRLTKGGRVLFVHLAGSFELIDARMKARKNHFMPPSLLESQFATLEPPGPDEPAISVPIDAEPAAIVAAVLARIG